MKSASTHRVEVRRHLADPKLRVGVIAGAAIHIEFHGQLVDVRLAHLRGPPQPRIREHKLRKLIRSKSDVLGLVGCQLHVLLEIGILNAAFELTLDRLIRAVLDLCGDRKLCVVICRRIQLRDDGWIAQRDRAAGR